MFLIIIAKWNFFSWPESENILLPHNESVPESLLASTSYMALKHSVISSDSQIIMLDTYNEAKFTLKQTIANAACFGSPNVSLSIIAY